jgi:hypothetical protein
VYFRRMKASGHGFFLVAAVLLIMLVFSSTREGVGIGFVLEVVGLFVSLVLGIISMRKQNLAELNLSSGNPVELQQTLIRSGAEYSFKGIYRRGELRKVDEVLIFESAGLDDFGPFYKFHNSDIVKIKSGASSFLNGEELIVVLRDGRQENFRVKSAQYWLNALSSWGKNEQAIP